MSNVQRTPALTLTTRSTDAIDADLLVVPVFDDDEPADEAGLDAASGGEIAQARARGELRGTLYEVVSVALTTGRWKTPRAALVGAGRRAEFGTDRLRRIAIVGGLAARQRRLARIAVLFRPAPRVTAAQAVQALAEGVVLANYDGAAYKTGDPPKAWIEQAALRVAGDAADLEAALERGRVLGETSNLARELVNEPANHLTPRALAERGAALGREAGLQVEVLDEAHITALRMELLLGVARGSQEPPRLVVLRHEPAAAVEGVVLGLVGKGVTFDTGGISIKPAEHMDKMKGDMSGAAAVIGAMTAIARLGAPVRCIGVVPMTENMPGGTACKPGDVLTSASGKTVEVLNTDAEGRLILGDAVWFARHLGATHLVDVATLTGACVIALGKTTSGLFGTPDAWADAVYQAAQRAGDRAWRMPLFDDYREHYKSEIADFANVGTRTAGGGAITGALFIKEFAGDLPWAHLDIAGTAWAEEAKPYQPKGATGVAVRTLAELALAVGTWSKLKPEA